MLYLFDMDGTLIPSYMEKPKDQSFSHVELLPGRAERLRELHGEGHTLAIVTNQAGVAFGYQTHDETIAKIRSVIDLIGVPMTIHVCEAHEKAKVPELKWGSGRRKPSPQMLLEAMRRAGVAPADTLMVGDMETDREAASWAGVRYFDESEFFDG